MAVALAVACSAAAASAGAHGAHGTRGASGLRGTVGGHAQGYLGIEFRDLTDEEVSKLRLHGGRGVEVLMVDHDGPAGKSGLRQHDIIVSINAQPLSGAEALRRMIHDTGAGTQISLGVVRAGRPITLSAQLADRDAVVRAAVARLAASDVPRTEPASAPPPSGMVYGFVGTYTVEPTPQPAAPLPSPPARGFIGNLLHGGPSFGAVLEAVGPQLAGYFGAPQGAGLLVHSVAPDSPAANAGLRAGDVVLRADLYTLHTSADWTKRLHAAKGRPVTLSVLRDHHELTLTLQPDLKHHSMVEWPRLF